MIDGEFEEITRALVSYVMEDAKCPRCLQVDECLRWCRFLDQHSTTATERLSRARVAVHCYREKVGCVPR